MAILRPSLYALAALALILSLTPAPSAAVWLGKPDPNCNNGIFKSGVCCPKGCGTCGGPGCGQRGQKIKSQCCVNIIKTFKRNCKFVGAPCKNARTGGIGDMKPDPQCKQGIYRWRACCPKRCGVCGGNGCWKRGQDIGLFCCTWQIRPGPKCNKRGAPCSFVGLPIPGQSKPKPPTTPKPPTKPPTKPKSPTKPKTPTKPKQPPPAPPSGGGKVGTSTKWVLAQVQKGQLSRRHEACAVMAAGKVYLIGGRGKNKPVSIYNPKTKTWVNQKGPGVELHHMQCVLAGGRIWVVTSWNGGYPKEKNNDKVYIYNVNSGKWSTKPGLPEPRRRGGAAAVLRGDFIYVIGGNRGGHGDHATSYGWMDAYNWKTFKWTTNLPSVPVARDHTGGAVVGNRICIAGGRNGGRRDFFWQNKKESYCYNFGKKAWEPIPPLPTARGGANTGRICSGGMMVAGGEGEGKAYNLVHVFNGSKWVKFPNLSKARHGSGLAVAQCGCGQIFIPSGSGAQGGSPELFSTEKFMLKGKPEICNSY